MLLIKVASLLICAGSISVAAEDPVLLVGNTRGDNIVRLFEEDLIEFIGGLSNPDHIRIVDDYLYVAVGDTLNSSTIYRKNLKSGDVDEDFLKGGGLLRPYGFDFYKGRIYVSSFLTDKVIIYEMDSGNYIGVFAQGDGTEEGLCNGPNHISIHDDKLYLTTQGSVAVDGEPEYLWPSQIIVYDLLTGEGGIFAGPPDPLPDSLGFVSMLGIQIYCEKYNCLAYTTDFAGGLRAYALDGTLVYEVSTSYDPGSTVTGALSVVDGEIYIPGYVSEDGGGVVQRFSAKDGSPLPASGQDGAIFVPPSDELIRPIGIFALETNTGGGKGKKRGKRGRKLAGTSYSEAGKVKGE
jgi:outer membrane protein assembly factor BamB